MSETLGIAGFLLWVVLAVGTLLVLAFALGCLANSKAEATVAGSPDASRAVRRWAIVAIVSGVLFLGTAGLAVFIYVSCVGEC